MFYETTSYFRAVSPQWSLLAKLDPFASAQTMLFSDPPVHTRLRRLVTPYFRPGRINLLTPRFQTVTNQLLDNIESKAEFDAVSDLACPVTLAGLRGTAGCRSDRRGLHMVIEQRRDGRAD